jgi:hypothetical protein
LFHGTAMMLSHLPMPCGLQALAASTSWRGGRDPRGVAVSLFAQTISVRAAERARSVLKTSQSVPLFLDQGRAPIF